MTPLCKRSNSIFVSEPYRLFFPLGILAAAIGTGYWVLVYFSIAPIAPLFHGMFQTELFGAAFAVGFLMTAIPKFSGANPANHGEVVVALALYGLTPAALLLGRLAISQYAFFALMFSLVLFAIRRVRSGENNLPPSFTLVGAGLLCAICGSIFLLFPLKSFLLLGSRIVEHGMLLCFTLGVGAFLGPRLMGVVQAELKSIGVGATHNATPIYKNSLFISALTALMIFLSFGMEALGQFKLAGFMRAIFATWHLWHFGVLSTPRSNTLIGRVVALALWLTVVGLWLSVLVASDIIGINHVTFIGGYALLIIAIGSQVTSSHAGQPEFWKRNYRRMIAVFGAVLVALVVRVVAARFPASYLSLIAISSVIFIAALAAWAPLILPLMGAKKLD